MLSLPSHYMWNTWMFNHITWDLTWNLLGHTFDSTTWTELVIFLSLSVLYRLDLSGSCWSVTFPFGSVVFTDCSLTQLPSPPCFTRSCVLGTCYAALPSALSFVVCRWACSTKQFLVSSERISQKCRPPSPKCKLSLKLLMSDYYQKLTYTAARVRW